jgi:hypothetical protein
MRWAGTVHRKDPSSPRLCRIVEENPGAEIALEHALDELEGLAALRGQAAGGGAAGPGAEPEAGEELLAAVAEVLTNPLPPKEPGGEPREDRADWNRIGMAFFRASGGSEAGLRAFLRFTKKNTRKHHSEETARARWEHYRKSPPTRIGAGTLVYEARRCDPNFRPPLRAGRQAMAGDDAPTTGGDTLLDLSHDGLALALGEKWAEQARHVAPVGQVGCSGRAPSGRWTSAPAHDPRPRLPPPAGRRARAGGRSGRASRAHVDKAAAVAKGLRSAQTVAHVVGLGPAATRGRPPPSPCGTPTRGRSAPRAASSTSGTASSDPADPLAYCTKSTAVAPAPPGTPAPIWQGFLERIFRHDPS